MILKATQGLHYVDPTYAARRQAALAQGLLVRSSIRNPGAGVRQGAALPRHGQQPQRARSSRSTSSGTPTSTASISPSVTLPQARDLVTEYPQPDRPLAARLRRRRLSSPASPRRLGRSSSPDVRCRRAQFNAAPHSPSGTWNSLRAIGNSPIGTHGPGPHAVPGIGPSDTTSSTAGLDRASSVSSGSRRRPMGLRSKRARAAAPRPRGGRSSRASNAVPTRRRLRADIDIANERASLFPRRPCRSRFHQADPVPFAPAPRPRRPVSP